MSSSPLPPRLFLDVTSPSSLSVSIRLFPEPPQAFVNLPDDILDTILDRASFPSLRCLQTCSYRLRYLAKRALAASRFSDAREYYAELEAAKRGTLKDVLKVMADSHHTSVLLLFEDDVEQIECFCELRLLHPRVPLSTIGHLPSGVHVLHLARSREAVDVLVRYGADVDAERANGMTPLMDACVAGEHAVVEALCENGADINRRCASGDSLLRFAEQELEGRNRLAYHSNWRFRNYLAPWPDGVACLEVLTRFGARGGLLSRASWHKASCDAEMLTFTTHPSVSRPWERLYNADYTRLVCVQPTTMPTPTRSPRPVKGSTGRCADGGAERMRCALRPSPALWPSLLPWPAWSLVT